MLLTDNDVCQSVDLIRQNTVTTRRNRAKKAKFTQSSYTGESSAVAHNKRVHRSTGKLAHLLRACCFKI